MMISKLSLNYQNQVLTKKSYLGLGGGGGWLLSHLAGKPLTFSIFTNLSYIIISGSFFNNYHWTQPLVLPHLPSSSFTENFLERAIYTAPSTSSLSSIQSTTKIALWISKGASSERGFSSLNPRDSDLIDLRPRNPRAHSNSGGSENAEGGLTCPFCRMAVLMTPFCPWVPPCLGFRSSTLSASLLLWFGPSQFPWMEFSSSATHPLNLSFPQSLTSQLPLLTQDGTQFPSFKAPELRLDHQAENAITCSLLISTPPPPHWILITFSYHMSCLSTVYKIYF